MTHGMTHSFRRFKLFAETGDNSPGSAG